MDSLGTVDVVAAKLDALLEGHEYALPSGVRSHVNSLREELLSLREELLIIVFSVDELDTRDSLWVTSVRDIAYDIEDSVDLFTVRVDAAAGNPSRFQRWFLSIAHKLTTLSSSTRHTISSNELKNFKARLIELENQRHLLMEGPFESRRNVEARPSVLFIAGMAGSGKTTLAKKVYKRLQKKKCFQRQAFVSVGQRPDLKKTLMDVLSMLTDGNQVDGEDIENLIVRLRETLERKRYLIVVDDLWSMEHWEETMKNCFPENSLGSRIIITTWDVQLANELATARDCIYDIELLSEADSKDFVPNRAFGTGRGCPQDLDGVFAQIITRCAGLPPAVDTAASMLAYRSSMGQWGTPRLDRIYNLSPRLRTFLLYLSIFPEDYEVDIARLMRLWIAEGFVFETHRTSRKEEEAISDLINELGLVQPLHLDLDGVPRYCRLHPEIHNVLVCKSMEEKFVTVVNVQDDQYFPINNGTVHRLSLQGNSNRVQAVVRKHYADLSRARSISVFGQASSTPHLSDLKVVRVLDLEGCDGPVCLEGLSKLLHLRYLSLRGTGVSELPATIGELRCLQTLDVSSTKVRELPPSIGELLRLRYLNIQDTGVSELPVARGKLRCLETLDVRSTKVKDLLPFIAKLKHTLKVLLVNGNKGLTKSTEPATRMPEDIQNCRRLEKLGIIDLREHHASFVKVLGGLNRLRVLKITWSSQQSNEKAYRQALVSSIEKWSQLEYLTIHCGFLCSMEFLGSLSNPPLNIKKFKVTAGRFAVIPQWISGLWFLSFMQITVCKLGSDDLSILRELPRLKCLILGLEFIPRETIVIENDGFKALRRFSVDCPVPWLTFSTEAMRWVEHLELKFCSGPASQKSVPSGIDNLRSLEEVVLCYNEKWCAKSSSVRMTIAAVKEEVSNHRNPIQLVINGTRVDVEQAEEATEICNEADRRGKAKVNVEVAGEGTSMISSSSSEIEEIEDGAKHGL